MKFVSIMYSRVYDQLNVPSERIAFLGGNRARSHLDPRPPGGNSDRHHLIVALTPISSKLAAGNLSQSRPYPVRLNRAVGDLSTEPLGGFPMEASRNLVTFRSIYRSNNGLQPLL